MHAFGRDRHRLRASARRHLGHEGEVEQAVHDGLGMDRGHEEVDVPDRLAHPPQGTGVLDPLHTGKMAEPVDELLGDVEGDGELHALAGPLGLADGAPEVLLARRPPTAQRPEPLFVKGVEEFRQRGDAQFVVDLTSSLGPEPGHAEQRPETRRHQCPQVVEIGDVPQAEPLANLAGNVGPDRGNGIKALVVQVRHIDGVVGNGPGRLLVCPHLEPVPARDGEKLGELTERIGDRIVRPGHGLLPARLRAPDLRNRAREVHGSVGLAREDLVDQTDDLVTPFRWLHRSTPSLLGQDAAGPGPVSRAIRPQSRSRWSLRPRESTSWFEVTAADRTCLGSPTRRGHRPWQGSETRPIVYRMNFITASPPITLTAADVQALPLVPLGPHDGVVHHVVWRDATSMAGVLTVPAGCRLGAHTHRVNHHHIWVDEGRAVVLGAELGPGSYAHVPSGVEHDIDATTTEGCTVFYLYVRPAR